MLLENINQNCIGIIVLKTQDWVFTNKTYQQINYLFDGLLVKTQNNDSKELPSHLHFTQLFGEKFFLIEVLSKNWTLEKIKELMALVQPQTVKPAEIVILKNSELNKSESSKIYSHFAARFKFNEFFY
jgi:hypothetical protein